ncbi:amidase [Negadavirga shengliensis]|uniref:Amidase n=1 Tax=Negadavirga shengliensis TaxID=1389218 RepID=A0ABV9T966_9BACT
MKIKTFDERYKTGFWFLSFKVTITMTFLFFASCQSNSQKKQESGDFPYMEWEAAQFLEHYKEGTLTVREVVEAYLQRIEALDRSGPCLQAVLEINPDALAIAEELDEMLQQGKFKGPLHGIPVLLKDNIDTHDQMHTTAGSRAMAGSRPLQDSYVAKKLRESGAVILGKTNLSEWANFRGELSSSGWSGLGGQTKSPYILDRNPCGSSSGSAVAVAANLTVLAIGTETNGSIVCPSHANGIVGIKPTVGLISRSGIIPISFTQDTPGPMARTVRDAALCLGVLAGVDEADEKTAESEGNFHLDYTEFLNEQGLKGKRIGWFTGPSGKNFKVDKLMQEAVEWIKKQDVEVVEIERISAPNTGSKSFEVMLFEYKDGLNKYFSSLGSEAVIKDLEDLIAFNREDEISLRYYNQKYLEMAQAKEGLDAQAYREALAGLLIGSRRDGIDRVMNEHGLHAIMAPTGSPAWKTDWVNGDSFQAGSSSPAAHAGYPNITVPMGMIDGLPVGISFFGKAWSEPLLLEIAYAFEQGTRHREPPKMLLRSN